MSQRTITLTVDQPQFFDEVRKYGLINSTCPIGSRVIACLLGGVDFREAAGLGCYGVQVFEQAALSSGEPTPAVAPTEEFRRGYREGWNDREDDLIAGVGRIYPAESGAGVCQGSEADTAQGSLPPDEPILSAIRPDGGENSPSCTESGGTASPKSEGLCKSEGWADLIAAEFAKPQFMVSTAHEHARYTLSFDFRGDDARERCHALEDAFRAAGRAINGDAT